VDTITSACAIRSSHWTPRSALDREIADRESEINALIYSLYKLAPDEIAMIEADRGNP